MFVRVVIYNRQCLPALSIADCCASLVSISSPQRPPPSSRLARGNRAMCKKVTTRLVTMDVMATDSRGNTVRDLKPEELQIFVERKAPQKIEHFEYFEKMAASGNSASRTPKSANLISNQLPLDQLKIPPTVFGSMDSLNTQTSNQQRGRMHMLQLLKTLPPDTPVAVFLLGSSLKILQGFTSDGKLLQAALDRAVAGSTIEQDPRDDRNSPSNSLLITLGGVDNGPGVPAALGEIEDYEREEYSAKFDLRAKETLGALAQIGQYLSGIPGRKNLIWVSESFPISVAPDPNTGGNSFAGIRDYSDQVINAANALTDAQVAIYPMDVLGLQANQALSAYQNVNLPQSMMTGPAIADRLAHEDSLLLQSQGTMDEIAQDTGGKACKNSNDLTGCVMTALKDGSSYYEMSFYPQNVNWDGRFHKILLKTTRPGVKLSYRRGFYALDASSLAKKLQPEAIICGRPAPICCPQRPSR